MIEQRSFTYHNFCHNIGKRGLMIIGIIAMDYCQLCALTKDDKVPRLDENIFPVLDYIYQLDSLFASNPIRNVDKRTISSKCSVESSKAISLHICVLSKVRFHQLRIFFHGFSQASDDDAIAQLHKGNIF